MNYSIEIVIFSSTKPDRLAEAQILVNRKTNHLLRGRAELKLSVLLSISGLSTDSFICFRIWSYIIRL